MATFGPFIKIVSIKIKWIYRQMGEWNMEHDVPRNRIAESAPVGHGKPNEK